MKRVDSVIRVLVLFSMVLSTLVGPGFNPVSVVHAQPRVQEEIPTPTNEETPTEIPAESTTIIPTEISTEVQNEDHTATPIEGNETISTEFPTDIPTEIPTLAPSFESTALITETPENTPTESLTATPTNTETPIETPVEIPTVLPKFKWDLEIKLNPDQASRIQSDAGITQRFSDNQIDVNLIEQSLFLSGDADLEQVRSVLFDGLGSEVDFLGGPVEININLPFNSGDEISVSLESRIISGFSWDVSPNNGANVLHVSSPQFSGSNGNEIETHSFITNESGDGTVSLIYRRPFGPTGDIHASLNIWLPEIVRSIDLTNPNPKEIQAIAESDSESDQSDPFDGIAQSIPPTEWDWRNLGVVSEIRDQGSCGSCWAFATVGIMESALKIANGISADLSEQFLVSCNNHGWDCSGGNVAHMYHQSTIGRLQTVSGAVLESDMEYEGSNGSCRLIANHPYKISNWGFISSSYYTVPTVAQIKSAIYTYGPITAGICAGSNFQGYSGGVFSSSDACTSTNGHVVNLVGWNDAEQYWILRNSWGEYWGENGYMRIKWGTSNVGYGASWVIYNAASAVPSKPILLSPVANAVINNDIPLLTWNSATNGNTYQVQVSKTIDFSSPVVDAITTSGVTNYTPVSPLSGDGLWYWRVRAFDFNGRDGDWSTSWSFTLDTTPPATPILSSPLEAATPVGIPSFTWLTSATANAYQFEIANNSGFINPFFSTPDGTISGQPAITSLTYKPSGLTAGILYYWHVRARDSVGNWSNWSSPRTINVQTSVPVAPVLTSPVAGFLTNTPPTLIWNSVTGGVEYQVQIANTSTFTGTIFEDRTKDPGVLTHTVETPLTDGVWYWRVRARNATNGASAWSAARAFTFDSIPPLAPVLSSPLAEALVRTTPAFTWVASATANAYQFEYGTTTDGTTVTFESAHLSPVRTTRSYTPPAMAIGGYYWRVKARDAAGNWGLWSELRKINVYPPKLAAPASLIPAAGALFNTLTPSFSWGNVPGGKKYNIQTSRLTSFSTSDPYTDTYYLSDGVLTFDDSDPLYQPLTKEGLWYWRISTTNVTDEMGTWSTYRSFTVDITPPGKPTLSLPANNAPYIRAIPSFAWKAVSGANAYQFEYDDDATFDDPLLTTPGKDIPGTPMAVIKYKPAGMGLLIPYFWHVRARDVAGNWGEWSDTRSITILPIIPSAPTLLSPATGFLTNNTTPIFTWGAVTNGNTYQIQIDKLSTFANLDKIDHTGQAGELSFTSDPIISNALYYWRVRAINLNNEAGVWSSARKFTVDTTPPLAPTLALPANDTLNIRAIPTFTWYAVSGATAYQFEYDDNFDFSSPALTTPGLAIPGTPLAVTSIKPATMSLLTPFYWHVRARDAAGNWGNWSETWSITILPTIPNAPALLTPATGFLTNDTTLTFTWGAVTHGNTYQIQIDKLSTFTNLDKINHTSLVGELTYTAGSITTEVIYYWRVRAINLNNEAGTWSAARKFILDTTPPLAPILSLPANDTLNIRAIPTFTWKAVTGANAYQFEYDDNPDFGSPALTTPGKDEPGTPLAVTAFKPGTMDLLTPFYWHVRARDVAGNWGDWSTSRCITILPTIPTAPALLTPATGFLSNDTTPTFTWGVVTHGNTYQIQIDKLFTFANLDKIEHIGMAGELTFTTDPISLNTLYFWRVRAINLNNEGGTWSTARTFTIDTTTPVAPILSTPLDAATPVGIPSFTWLASATANAYQYEFDDNNDFSSPVFSTPDGSVSGQPTITTRTYKPAGMIAGRLYYWHVRARDAAGNWSAWSTPRFIIVQTSVPIAPVLTNPATGFLTNSPPTFTWNSVTGGVEYQVQIANTSTFTGTIFEDRTKDPGVLTHTVETPLTDGVWYWRVRARNATNGASAWSTARAFTFDSIPPLAPVLTSPASEAIVRSTPTFSWAASPTANAYQFEYGTTIDGAPATFTSVHLSPIIATKSYTPPAISIGGYYWRVKARDAADNWGSWCDLRKLNLIPP